jgi:hypothetical protein
LDAGGSSAAGRRLKAPEEGNRGQQGLCYGDFIERPSAAVSKLRRLFVVACRKLGDAASKAGMRKLQSGARLLWGMAGGQSTASAALRPVIQSSTGLLISMPQLMMYRTR